MALSNVNRVRIIFDLLKDAQVTTEANYDSSLIDYMDAATAVKYAEALITVRSPESGDPAGMSAGEKSRLVLNILRQFIRQSLVVTRDVDAVKTAKQNAKATALAEADTDIGADE